MHNPDGRGCSRQPTGFSGGAAVALTAITLAVGGAMGAFMGGCGGGGASVDTMPGGQPGGAAGDVTDAAAGVGGGAGRFAVLKATEGGGVLDVARLLPLEAPQQRLVAIVEGGGGEVGEEQLLRLTMPREQVGGAGGGLAASPGARWRVVRCERKGSDGALLTEELTVEHFRIGEDGSLELERTEKFDDDVVTWFEPPLRVWPSGLAGGGSVVQKLRMVVRPMGDPGSIKTQGDAEHTVEVLGEDRVVTPSGEEFTAVRMRRTLRAKLGIAEVEVAALSWLAERVGVVAERARERVNVLGVTIRRSDESWGLLDRGPQAAGALAEFEAARR